MIDLLFYIFSGLMIFGALVMILSPNAVNSAMCMIVTLVATAGLFVLLEAYFLAILQVLVYAGAVMVLFLFIIMLLDVDKEKASTFKNKTITSFAVLISFLLLLVLTYNTFMGSALPAFELSPLSDAFDANKGLMFSSEAKSFGYLLFTKYMLPFQVIGFLLLIAMVGVIVISKKSRNS